MKPGRFPAILVQGMTAEHGIRTFKTWQQDDLGRPGRTWWQRIETKGKPAGWLTMERDGIICVKAVGALQRVALSLSFDKSLHILYRTT